MEVNKVNNQNSNVGLYTGIATVIGGGAGALAGWNTKPFLKGDVPSDEFVKNVIPKMENIIPEDNEVYVEVNKLVKDLNAVETIDELKASMLKPLEETCSAINNVENLKQMLKISSKNAVVGGDGYFSPEEIDNIKSIDDFWALCKKSLDKKFEGKTLKDLRDAAENDIQNFKKKFVCMMFDELWDKTTKNFIKIDKDLDIDDGIKTLILDSHKIMVDAANNMKGKMALIKGLSTATVAGLGTFIGVKLFHKADNKVIEQDLYGNIQE